MLIAHYFVNDFFRLLLVLKKEIQMIKQDDVRPYTSGGMTWNQQSLWGGGGGNYSVNPHPHFPISFCVVLSKINLLRLPTTVAMYPWREDLHLFKTGTRLTRMHVCPYACKHFQHSGRVSKLTLRRRLHIKFVQMVLYIYSRL